METPSGSRRLGWALLGLVALVAIAFGLKGVVTGSPGSPAVVRAYTGMDWATLRTREPGVARLVTLLSRHEGIALLGWGLWLACSALVGFRTGARWAWYGWWPTPLVILGFTAVGSGAGGLRGVLLGTALLSVLGILLARPARR